MECQPATLALVICVEPKRTIIAKWTEEPLSCVHAQNLGCLGLQTIIGAPPKLAARAINRTAFHIAPTRPAALSKGTVMINSTA